VKHLQRKERHGLQHCNPAYYVDMKHPVVPVMLKVKQSHYRPLGFQELEAHRFIDNRHMKVVRLLALRTGRLYPPENTPGTHFC
jgi:hypothetical protein